MVLPEITKTEIIHVEDGDVLGVFVKGYNTQESLERIRQELCNKFLPKKINVVIINADVVDLKVLRAE